MRLNLTNAQFKGLVNALDQAFDQHEFGALLQLECGERLERLVGLPMPLLPLVTEVVRKAEQKGFTDLLVLGASAWRPRDPTLTAILQELLQTPGQGRALSVSAAGLGTASSADEALQGIVRRGEVFADVAQFIAELVALSSRVCRIESLEPKGAAPRAFGTGFLIADDVVLTNHHVKDALLREGKAPLCRFDYRVTGGSASVREGLTAAAAGGNCWLAESPPAIGDRVAGGTAPAPNQLDYAALRLQDPVGAWPCGRDGAGPGELRGHLTLDTLAPSAQTGQDVFVLQHPNGAPMKLAVGRVLECPIPLRVRHDAPTEPGTSGSPCLNARLELVALHHATDPRDPANPGFNQAVPIGLIARDLVDRGVL